jgi:hypothetical protein
MGQRLNLEQDALATILPDRTDRHNGGVAGGAYELSYSTSNHLHAQNQQQGAHMTSEAQMSNQNKRPSVGMGGLQEMMGRLRGMEGQRSEMPVPTQIIVTTHEDTRVD